MKIYCKITFFSLLLIGVVLIFPKNIFAQEAQTADKDLGASLPKVSAPLANPNLSVAIPGFSGFKNINCDNPQTEESDGATCVVSWLAEFINALFRYGIGVIVLLAVVVMMIGGVIWLTAAGKEEKINDAKGLISGSILGIIIAMSSYIILNIINPTLTVLSPIKIAYVAMQDLPEMSKEEVIEEQKAVQTGDFKTRTTTEYIIVHTAAAIMTRDQVDTLHKTEGIKGKKAAGIGYNLYIERDGRLVEGRGKDKVGAHTANWNSKSIGISYSGCAPSTGQKPNQKLSKAVENDTIEQAQINTLVSTIKSLQSEYRIPREKVIGHAEACNGCKACPCLNMDEIRALISP